MTIVLYIGDKDDAEKITNLKAFLKQNFSFLKEHSSKDVQKVYCVTNITDEQIKLLLKIGVTVKEVTSIETGVLNFPEYVIKVKPKLEEFSKIRQDVYSDDTLTFSDRLNVNGVKIGRKKWKGDELLLKKIELLCDGSLENVDVSIIESWLKADLDGGGEFNSGAMPPGKVEDYAFDRPMLLTTAGVDKLLDIRFSKDITDFNVTSEMYEALAKPYYYWEGKYYPGTEQLDSQLHQYLTRIVNDEYVVEFVPESSPWCARDYSKDDEAKMIIDGNLVTSEKYVFYGPTLFERYHDGQCEKEYPASVLRMVYTLLRLCENKVYYQRLLRYAKLLCLYFSVGFNIAVDKYKKQSNKVLSIYDCEKSISKWKMSEPYGVTKFMRSYGMREPKHISSIHVRAKENLSGLFTRRRGGVARKGQEKEDEKQEFKDGVEQLEHRLYGIQTIKDISRVPFVQRSKTSHLILNSAMSFMDLSRCQTILSGMLYTVVYGDIELMCDGIWELVCHVNKTPMKGGKNLKKNFGMLSRFLQARRLYFENSENVMNGIDVDGDNIGLIEDADDIALAVLVCQGFDLDQELDKVETVAPSLRILLEDICKSEKLEFGRDLIRVLAFIVYPEVIDGYSKTAMCFLPLKSYNSDSIWRMRYSMNTCKSGISEELDEVAKGICEQLNAQIDGDTHKKAMEQMMGMSLMTSAGLMSAIMDVNINTAVSRKEFNRIFQIEGEDDFKIKNLKTNAKRAIIPLGLYRWAGPQVNEEVETERSLPEIYVKGSKAGYDLSGNTVSRSVPGRDTRPAFAVPLQILFNMLPYKNASKSWFESENKRLGYPKYSTVAKTPSICVNNFPLIKWSIQPQKGDIRRVINAADLKTADQQMIAVLQWIIELAKQNYVNESSLNFESYLKLSGKLKAFGWKKSYKTVMLESQAYTYYSLYRTKEINCVLEWQPAILKSGGTVTTETNNCTAASYGSKLMKWCENEFGSEDYKQVINGDDTAISSEFGCYLWEYDEEVLPYVLKIKNLLLKYGMNNYSGMDGILPAVKGNKFLLDQTIKCEMLDTVVGSYSTEYLKITTVKGRLWERGSPLDSENSFNIDDAGNGLIDKYCKVCEKMGTNESFNVLQQLALIVGARTSIRGFAFRPHILEFAFAGTRNKLFQCGFTLTSSKLWLEICSAKCKIPVSRAIPINPKPSFSIGVEGYDSVKLKEFNPFSQEFVDADNKQMDLRKEFSSRLLMNEERLECCEKSLLRMKTNVVPENACYDQSYYSAVISGFELAVLKANYVGKDLMILDALCKASLSGEGSDSNVIDVKLGESQWVLIEDGSYSEMCKTRMLCESDVFRLQTTNFNFEIIFDERHEYVKFEDGIFKTFQKGVHNPSEDRKRQVTPYVQVDERRKLLAEFFGTGYVMSDIVESEGMTSLKVFNPSHFNPNLTSSSVIDMLKRQETDIMKREAMYQIGFNEIEISRATPLFPFLKVIELMEEVTSYGSVSSTHLKSLKKNGVIESRLSSCTTSIDQKSFNSMFIGLMYSDLCALSDGVFLFRIPTIVFSTKY